MQLRGEIMTIPWLWQSVLYFYTSGWAKLAMQGNFDIKEHYPSGLGNLEFRTSLLTFYAARQAPAASSTERRWGRG